MTMSWSIRHNLVQYSGNGIYQYNTLYSKPIAILRSLTEFDVSDSMASDYTSLKETSQLASGCCCLVRKVKFTISLSEFLKERSILF